jgi:hypothetical protein
MATIFRVTKAKYAAGIFFRPTFEGKRRLRVAAKANGLKQGDILRRLIEKGITEDGKISLK